MVAPVWIGAASLILNSAIVLRVGVAQRGAVNSPARVEIALKLGSVRKMDAVAAAWRIWTALALNVAQRAAVSIPQIAHRMRSV